MSDWYYLDKDNKTPIPYPTDSRGYPDFMSPKVEPGDRERGRIGNHEFFKLKSKDGGRLLVRDRSQGRIRISTVFLGLDHGYGDGPPVLWETMIFGGEHDEYQERYTNYDDAVAGHKRAIALVEKELNR